jgi:hypothetical protein
LFEQSHPTNVTCAIDWVNVAGNEWSCTVQGESGPLRIKGYRFDVLRWPDEEEFLRLYRSLECPDTPVHRPYTRSVRIFMLTGQARRGNRPPLTDNIEFSTIHTPKEETA